MSTLKTQAEIMERGRVKASTTVYSGPGYPVDPKAEEARLSTKVGPLCNSGFSIDKLLDSMGFKVPDSLKLEPPKKKHMTIGGIKAVIKEWDVPPYNWYEFVDDDQKAFPA